MKATGKIIVCAYPDTFVKVSTEWVCKLLPLLGLGTREYIKAGHAALVLIENATGKARYFDFGRYVTPEGHGRVRGENTDAELHFPIEAKISSNGELQNIAEMLNWLEGNPLKTHGQGRLLASVCDAIDFDTAYNFIISLQQQGSIPYGAFNKTGSNCSRFVTDTILTATSDKSIIKALNFNKKFTPSTVGNVEKAAVLNEVYEILNGKIRIFDGSALRENLKNYFHKKKPSSDTQKIFKLPPSAQKLVGTGSNAWFEILEEKLPKDHFRIRRYNDISEIDFDGIYRASEKFDASETYVFTYDSHCGYCHVVQKEKKIKFEVVNTYTDFLNSWRKVHSA